ncbi:T9SS type A sorting domain-containing protein [Chryseobacterium sp. ERMR1:04]|uniref:T9SS type A sorting domain-containing protein n=1 Tax=Chryseobacterium sp. ERMR1:04 TaxID=1705393 RepID=UPI0006C88AB5|nr:T9SS type A sorting domain-containing protein [Chryseobacterium sp. ERMR1:04]KPH12832.1 hypothetical protein AMQ68_14280 [Chryseobacterium sp. ERMR1:04]
MKKIYLIIFMILFSVFKAQIVNIPDANLKTKLLAYGTAYNSLGNPVNIDSNNDGEIQISETQSVFRITLNMPNSGINNFTGLEAFLALQELQLFNPNSTNLNLTFTNYPSLKIIKISGGNIGNGNLTIENMNSLELIDSSMGANSVNIINTSVNEMRFNNNPIHHLNLANISNLKKIGISNSNIQNLDLSNQNLLEDVSIGGNSVLTAVNFTNDISIKKLNLNNNKLSNLSLTNPSLVENINIGSNLFQNFNLSSYTGLKIFEASYNQLTNLDFSACSVINSIYLENNLLNSLTFNNNTYLTRLFLKNNQLQSLALDQIKYVYQLDCSNNHLTTVDLSQNSFLGLGDCSNNPYLKVLITKNGRNNYATGANLFTFYNVPQLQYICCDPEELFYLSSAVSSMNLTNTVVNTYCSFTPGGTFYTIQGNIKYDSNNNGCDNNDVNKAFQKFNITDGFITGTFVAGNSGNYSTPVQPGAHTITPIIENPTYFNVSPTSVTANFPTQTSPLTQNFCLTANGTHNDLEIVIIPLTAATPSFDAKYKIIYKNKGTITQSGTISFNYNDNLMDYLNTTIVPNSQSTGVVNWNFANLLPFETKEITVTFKLNTPTQTPALNGGDILHFTTQINAGTDETPLDNIFTLHQTVVNSFDPNDKTCLEGTSISQAKVGDYVHYLIRFENTGTANAQNIVVKDVIDTSKFDLSSLIALNGSHSFVTRITNPNTVEFIFENIQLPFDDANNDGYISFKIKTKSTLNLGDSFSNTANIYFDYNHPIITNTYTTSVQNVLATSEINNYKSIFTIYPNPVKDVLSIQSKDKIVKAEIYDAAGRVLKTISVTDNSMNVSELAKGNYIIKLSTKDKMMTQKFIKN